MLRKYGILLAVCAVLLLAGCGNDKSTTDTKGPEHQQEVNKDTVPDEKMEKGTTQEDTDQKGDKSMKNDMDKIMPEKNIYKERQTFQKRPPATGIFRT